MTGHWPGPGRGEGFLPSTGRSGQIPIPHAGSRKTKRGRRTAKGGGRRKKKKGLHSIGESREKKAKKSLSKRKGFSWTKKNQKKEVSWGKSRNGEINSLTNEKSKSKNPLREIASERKQVSVYRSGPGKRGRSVFQGESTYKGDLQGLL